MGFGVRVLPGLRLSVTGRGLRAGIGPRAGRIHVGAGRPTVSTGAGPYTAWTGIGGGSASHSPFRDDPEPAQPNRADERAREARRLERLTAALTSVHTTEFAPSTRAIADDPEPVDQSRISEEVNAELGIPQLAAAAGGGNEPATADSPKPVDNLALLREQRLSALAVIPRFQLRQRSRALDQADVAAHERSAALKEQALNERTREQEQLDGAWAELEEARERAAEMTRDRALAEQERRRAEWEEEQAALDAVWERLQGNDPEAVIAALEDAFEDNAAPAAAIGVDEGRVTVIVLVGHPDSLPEKKPAVTPGGKPTAKKMSKTEANELYLEAIASHALAVQRETFAVAAGASSALAIAVRRADDTLLEPVLAAQISRTAAEDGQRASSALSHLEEDGADLVYELTGRAGEVAALELEEAELDGLIEAVDL